MKINSLISILALVLALSACGSQNTPQQEEATAEVENSMAESTNNTANSPFLSALAEVKISPSLQALLAEQGDYKVVKVQTKDTPEVFVQPMTDEEGENEAHIFGKCLLNGFTFVLVGIITPTGSDVFHLVAFDGSGKEVGVLTLSAGAREGETFYYSKYEANAEGVITLINYKGRLDSDQEEETGRTRQRFDFSQKTFVEVQ
ncbi:MAG: hypothetical protein OHK0057_17930 [Thermoflexibacter sp.]